MTDIDHFAEAARLVRLAEEQLPAHLDSFEAMEAYAHLAELHTHLAAIQAHTPAGHPVLPYREELAAWREAVLELLELLEIKNAAPPDVKAAAGKVRRLLGSPS